MIVGGTQLYYWHVRRTGEAELERTIKQIGQAFKEREETRAAMGADVPMDTYMPDTRALKNGISVQRTRFFWSVYRST